MTAARRVLTTIVRASTNAATLSASATTRELVAQREELFTAEEMKRPEAIRDAFHKVQRHIAESTQAARSLPIQGGTYWPDLTVSANTAHTFRHGIVGGMPVSWIALAVRPMSPNALAVTQGRVIEVSQDAKNGRITLASSEAATVDLWFFPKPSASP